ncbi:hypothetical protein OUZ56_010744 [Daphnia magna]|uniref:Uncharacterized protein n=1 Tax=Daphnia magna TaxID=35525 RepID=A0ABQ9YYH0_9CRUS|nr:hypothetical protein OUZ56_010744 [Daphnia magna]
MPNFTPDRVVPNGSDVDNDVGIGPELLGGSSVVAGRSDVKRRTGTALEGPSSCQLELRRPLLYCWLTWLETGVGGAGVLILGTATLAGGGQAGVQRPVSNVVATPLSTLTAHLVRRNERPSARRTKYE